MMPAYIRAHDVWKPATYLCDVVLSIQQDDLHTPRVDTTAGMVYKDL